MDGSTHLPSLAHLVHPSEAVAHPASLVQVLRHLALGASHHLNSELHTVQLVLLLQIDGSVSHLEPHILAGFVQYPLAHTVQEFCGCVGQSLSLLQLASHSFAGFLQRPRLQMMQPSPVLPAQSELEEQSQSHFLVGSLQVEYLHTVQPVVDKAHSPAVCTQYLPHNPAGSLQKPRMHLHVSVHEPVHALPHVFA